MKYDVLGTILSIEDWMVEMMSMQVIDIMIRSWKLFNLRSKTFIQTWYSMDIPRRKKNILNLLDVPPMFVYAA